MTEEYLRGPLERAEDRTVAGRASDGDVEAFAVLVRRYTPMMRASVRRLLNASDEVDDIVQETFVVAWERLPELDDPAHVKSWLLRIAGRRAIDRLRARKSEDDIDAVEPPAPPHASPPRIVETRAEIQALRDALRELPADQRECWMLREVSGHSYEEIAAELRIPPTTVRGLLARARKNIIVRMEGWR